MKRFGEFIVDDDVPARRGGMGIVHKAWRKNRPFAVKIYQSSRIENRVLEAVFEREAAALRALKHPNIVGYHDAGYSEEEGAYYIVLDWLDETIEDHLARTDDAEEPLRWWDHFSARFALPLLRAIHFAHNREIRHRDIKPANILVNADGEVLLADFGIAKVLTDGQTLEGFRSPRYTPPEGQTSFSSDLYSLGVSFLELLLGDSFPWDKEDLAERHEAAMHAADLREPEKEYFRRLTAVDPEGRFHTSGQALSHLEALLSDRPDAESPAGLRLSLIASRRVQEIVGSLTGTRSSEQLPQIISSDLEPLRARYRGKDPERGDSWDFYGNEFTYIARRDASNPNTRFAMVDAWSATAMDAEFAGRAVEFPLARISFLRPADSHKAEEDLLAFVRECQRQADIEAAHRQSRLELELLDRWQTILDAREKLRQKREQPLSYRGFERRGSQRVAFDLQHTIDEEDVLGQVRSVAARGGYEGVVESVDGSYLVLRTTRPEAGNLPGKGVLRVDQRADKVAIRREMHALRDTRDQTSVRPDLRDLLTNPDRVEAAVPAVVTFFNQQLDDPKRDAIAISLGSPDFTVVEGPPGTGKTTFIAELILQQCSRGKRVVLSAQSHAAVDNAIERLNESGLAIVRIGQQEKINQKIFDRYHISGAISEWASEVEARSRNYLEVWADKQGLNKQVRAVLSYRHQVDQLESALIKTEHQVDALAQLEAAVVASIEDPDSVDVNLDQEIIDSSGIDPEDLDPAATPDLQERLSTIQGHLETVAENHDMLQAQLRNVLDAASSVAGQKVTSGSHLRQIAGSVGDDSSSPSALREYEALTELQQEWLGRFGTGDEYEVLFLANVDVIAGTCSGVASVPALENVTFDLAVIDEASKASPTETLVPMTRAASWVLVGDTRQLPPYVDRDIGDHLDDSAEDDLGETLFERLLEGLPDANRARLTEQHRMVPEIGELISQAFYEGTLTHARQSGVFRSVSSVIDPPVKWLSTSRLDNRWEERKGTSFSNHLEADVIYQWIEDLDQAALSADEFLHVGVISGYAAQRDLMKRVLAQVQPSSLRVEVFSVDEFQGQERDVVFYSIARSNKRGDIGFLSSLPRLNVALSRGRDALVLVGDAEHVRHTSGWANPFKDVLDYFDRNPESAVLSPLQWADD